MVSESGASASSGKAGEAALVRTSEAILRKRGRRTATEAAMMPVPGSAVAQMVALTEVVEKWVSLTKRPERYTIRMMLLMLPTAPSAMTRPTLILALRSRALSSKTEIGIRTKVQSAITLMEP